MTKQGILKKGNVSFYSRFRVIIWRFSCGRTWSSWLLCIHVQAARRAYQFSFCFLFSSLTQSMKWWYLPIFTVDPLILICSPLANVFIDMHKGSKTFYPMTININYHNSLSRLWVHMRSYVCQTKEGRSLPLEQMHSASHKYSRSIHESWKLSFKSPKVVRSKITSEQYQDPLFMVQPTVHCCYGQSSRLAGHQKWHVLLHLFLFGGRRGKIF